MNDDDGYERGEMVSLDRFQVTQHHNQPALQGKKQSACQAYPLAHQLFTFPNLTFSPSHPLTPSPHPLTPPPPPTYILASLPKEHVLPVHCIHCEGSPHRCQLHKSEEKHFCLQHAMCTSTNALSSCFSPGTAQYVGGGGGYSRFFMCIYLIVHSLSPSSTYKVSASGCFHALRILPILKSKRETSTAFSLPPPPPPPGEPSP